MILFDTHAHLTYPDFDADRDALLERAHAEGVLALTCGTNLDSSRGCLEIARRHPSVYAAVGFHPTELGSATADDWRRLEAQAAEAKADPAAKLAAIGEVGLDYFRRRDDPSRIVDPAKQRECLERALRLALDLDLAVLAHARDAAADVEAALVAFARAGGRAVWHCFYAGRKDIGRLSARLIDAGVLLGLGAAVTYSDREPLREILPDWPDTAFVLETDCPFMPPHPLERAPDGRRPRNTPFGTRRVAEVIAARRGVTVEDIARITTRNACALLRLPPPSEYAAARPAYAIRDSLYISLTNRCNNNCAFCARNHSWIVKGHDMRLPAEPAPEEVLREIHAAGGAGRFREIVFCGYGEPTLRLAALKEIARRLKAEGARVRVNSNGLANLEHRRDVAAELAGLVDEWSVSLNSADPEQYLRLCRTRFGAEAHAAVLDFIRRARGAGAKVTATAVAYPEIDLGAAAALARSLGADFRARAGSGGLSARSGIRARGFWVC